MLGRGEPLHTLEKSVGELLNRTYRKYQDFLHFAWLLFMCSQHSRSLTTRGKIYRLVLRFLLPCKNGIATIGGLVQVKWMLL